MLKTITTVVATLALSGFAVADDAVQWSEADGGNGHWYQEVLEPGVSWSNAADFCTNAGGHLATVTTAEENAFIASISNTDGLGDFGIWLGGYQDAASPDYSEPAGGWTWVTNEPWSYESWNQNDCHSSNQPDNANQAEGVLDYFCKSGDVMYWSDDGADWPSSGGYLIEYSADCNGDGIVDYGQILDGSLSDENGNGVPDCCDDTSCIPAVQWKIEDGGNGHWYKAVVCTEFCLWQDARNTAIQLGGDLVSLNTQLENEFVFSLIEDQPSLWFEFNGVYPGPYVGGFQDLSSPEYSEPDGAWMWVDGTWLEDGYAGWAANEPNNDCSGLQDQSYLAYMGIGAPEMTWNDIADECHNGMSGYVVEFSADCNGDGIVDYGQILDGSLADEDGNGIPDICELGDFGACCLAGTCVMTTATYCFEAFGAYGGKGLTCEDAGCPVNCPGDIDGDGQVGIVDILVVIDRWGFCP
ncbi:MAG: lectin-like protein [Phycisphaerales bacterium]|nr:lectin-like protein [Phycisphaerales bacterium]